VIFLLFSSALLISLNFSFICVLFLSFRATFRSRDSAVGIATGYGLDDRGVEFKSR
jgi:hypothetical protein